jgi:hypothetical protein
MLEWGVTSISTFGAPLGLDGQIAGAACADDAPASRAYGTGVERAYRTLASASAAALAGDAVFIRAGTCNERLALTQSGAKFQPIRRKRFGAGVVRFKP